MNVLYIDMNEYDLDEAKDIANLAREALGNSVVCLPSKTYLHQNVNIGDLRVIRDMVDNIIRQMESKHDV